MSCKVSFIGLGVMGYPMAGYISKAGHNVTVYNRTKSKAEKWIKQYKGKIAETPEDAAKDSDFVFTCVGNDDDLKEVADALTDILYVTYGAGYAYGIDLDKCFKEVQRANMSKLGTDGKPIYNDKGKVMKGPNYSEPNLKQFVE